MPNHAVLFLLIFILVIIHIRKANHSFHRVVKFYINSPRRDTADNSLIHFSDMSLHIFYLFHFIHFTLCLISKTLTVAASLCNSRQNGFIMGNSLWGMSIPQILFNNSMNLQIRITADWWSKVTVILSRQTKMSGVYRCILCPLHRTQSQTAQKSLFLCSFDFLN